MRAFCTVAVLAFVVLASRATHADGLLYKLPKDGTWADYELVGTTEGKIPDVAKGKDYESAGTLDTKTPVVIKGSIKGTLRMASVGQVSDGAQPCRWIEIILKMEVKPAVGESAKAPEGKISSSYFKVLIPEKYLVKGEAPLDHAIRAWYKEDPLMPREMKNPKDIDLGPLPIILSNPWKESKQLEKAEVESKLGKQTLEGIAGTLEFKIRGDKTMQYSLENRLHPDAPFGVVTSRWKCEQQIDNKMEMLVDLTYKLTDFGNDAKSEMPDAK
jgi:hypothetical protein